MKTGHVYKLCCSDVNVTDIYVGSTKSLRNRKQSHKCACTDPGNKRYNCPVYEFIRANGGWMNWSVVVIETIEYGEKHELLTRERHWIETLGATLNVRLPMRTASQYYQDNKESIAKQRHA